MQIFQFVSYLLKREFFLYCTLKKDLDLYWQVNIQFANVKRKLFIIRKEIRIEKVTELHFVNNHKLAIMQSV